ncbi:hypothetical protein BC936DRAFT_143256 [Jimgerdemannia flammicorona]|uniref:Uncharacterized protein n=1 Tax=Jimgerdemannia flammicorona TaxID=994334 RepID=A0A433DE70_9FUNG|nr:hypothetical protein BC936DRAFT_143256 [Jimgerdemannia flammicorona]
MFTRKSLLLLLLILAVLCVSSHSTGKPLVPPPPSPTNPNHTLLGKLMDKLHSILPNQVSPSVDPDVSGWSVAQLKEWLTDHDVDWKTVKSPEKRDYVALVLHYRRAARENADLAQAKVESALDELSSWLEKDGKITKQNAGKIVNTIKKSLVEVAKEGEVRGEALKKALANAKEEVVKQKVATAEEWDEIEKEVERGLIGARNQTQKFYGEVVKRAQDGLQTLLDRIRNELRAQKGMTEDNIEYIVNQVKDRIESVQDWGAAKKEEEEKWVDSVKKDLVNKKAVTEDQLQGIVNRIETIYIGYKAAAVGSAKGTYDTTQDRLQPLLDRVTVNLQQYKDLSQDTIDSVTTSLRARFSSTLPWVEPPPPPAYLEAIRADLEKRRIATASELNSILDTVRNTLDDYTSAFLAYAGAATATAQSAFSAATECASSAASSASSAASNVASEATSFAGSAASRATEAVVGKAEDAKEASEEEVQGVLDNIKKHLIETKDWSADQVNWVVAYVRDSLVGAKKATEQGVEGVVDGVRGYLAETKKASEDEITRVVDGIRQELQAWYQKVPWVGGTKKDEL